MDPERIYFFARSRPSGVDRLEGKYASRQPPGEGADPLEGDATPLLQFAGQYWWVEVDRRESSGDRAPVRRDVIVRTKGGEHEAMATEEIADALDAGARVKAIRGPFSSRQEAGQRMDLYWGAIMDHDDQPDEAPMSHPEAAGAQRERDSVPDRATVVRKIAEFAERAPESIGPDTGLGEWAPSARTLQAMLYRVHEVQKAFGVLHFNWDQLSAIKTVGNLADLILEARTR